MAAWFMTDTEQTRYWLLVREIMTSPGMAAALCDLVMLHPGSRSFNEAVRYLRENPAYAELVYLRQIGDG